MSKTFQFPASVLEVNHEVPVGTCNFVNTTFTTALLAIVGSLRVYINGIRLYYPTDYTTTEGTVTTITMAEAPHTNDLIQVDYTYKI